MAPTRPRIEQLRDAMCSVFAESSRVDVREFEDAEAGRIRAELTPRTASLLDRALRVLGEVLVAYAPPDAVPPEEPSQSFQHALERVLADLRASTRVSDLAFLAMAELQTSAARLQTHGPERDAWEMLSNCGSAVRRVQRSLSALEQAICLEAGLTRRIEYATELETALAIRKQYRKFWAFADSMERSPTAGSLEALRGAGTLVAMLIGRDVYLRLKEHDRHHIRSLQRRILEHFQRRGSSEQSGRRLWQDFAAFCQMLRQINLREVLVAHDNHLLAEAETWLVGQVRPLPQVIAAMQPLLGLDEQLDVALTAGIPEAAALLAEVRRLRAGRLPPSDEAWTSEAI